MGLNVHEGALVFVLLWWSDVRVVDSWWRLFCLGLRALSGSRCFVVFFGVDLSVSAYTDG